ncbi:MAG TPA: hypothetical protein VMS41_08925 [Gaiellaceae bacterium]|nr:hypothetical protein [Gaiellaceae bacterium]
MATTNARQAGERTRARVLGGSVRAGKRAGTDTRRATVALIRAVSDLVDKAVDQVVLGDERVGSAAEARQLLKRDERVEALTGEIQRVVALAVPVLRRLARGARFARVPWVFVATTTLSIGIAVRSGVKEIQTLSSLVAQRLERATGAPADPALVKKLAVDLYLHPRRAPGLENDRVRIVRLTRKWLIGGAFGRKTERRASRALEAAERIDVAALAAEWDSARRDKAGRRAKRRG